MQLSSPHLRIPPFGGGSSLGLGLTHYYKMEEASGTRADSVGSNTFTVGAGSVSSGTGKKGNGAAVSSGNYLITNTASLLTANFTVAFWINVSDRNNAASPAAIIGSDTANTGFDLAFSGIGTTTVTFTTYPGGNGAQFFGGDALSVGTFHSVILWFDGTFAKFRIDTATRSGGASSLSVASGTESISFSSQGAAFVIDELAVWNRNLNVGEQDLWYNNGAGRFYPLS